MRNPVRTGNWSGFYEDIAKGSESQVYYAPAQTIRLLLRYARPRMRPLHAARAALFRLGDGRAGVCGSRYGSRRANRPSIWRHAKLDTFLVHDGGRNVFSHW
jgi:hypothetical protein